MKRIFLLVVFLMGAFLVQAFNLLKKDTLPVNLPGYSLVWQDEFNGKNIDLSKWGYLIGKRRDAHNVKETVFVDGKGYLHIQTKKRGDSILTGMIHTENRFETLYGYFECRAKLTNASGIWPAFWLLCQRSAADNGTPENNGVEIDIFEYFKNQSK